MGSGWNVSADLNSLLPLAPAWRRGENPSSPAAEPFPTPSSSLAAARSAQAAARLLRPPARWGGRGFPPLGWSLDLPPGCRAGGAPKGVVVAGGGRRRAVDRRRWRWFPGRRRRQARSPTRFGGEGRRDPDGERPYGGSCGGSASCRWWCSCTHGWQRWARLCAPGLGRACGAGSMAARGVAAPGSSELLAPWWCR
jgi:hypothetical protein